MESHSSVIPNDEVLRYYFYFIQERMNIFWRKIEGQKVWTKDPILRKYKFTNVYRSCDRVSQYLISQVIYKNIDRYTPQDVLLRILVFKIFNKIATWEFLKETYGEISICHFDVKEISRLLSYRQAKVPIFSNAYMMTGTHRRYNHLASKHEKWLSMVQEEFIREQVVDEILKATSLKEVYDLLSRCSFLGGFLAYQYAIDFNYSPYINFSEDSFVKAGIGAIRGIKKCFLTYGREYEDAIRFIHDNFESLQQRYGYTAFCPLPGRKPSLLDLQNCFCETDKYLRQAMPELKVDNVRIKQIYKQDTKAIHYVFPPKWNITKEFSYSPIQQLFDF